MPELPEVESVRRLMRRVLKGKKIVDAEVAPDDIVLKKTPPEAVRAAVVGRRVQEIGRKGKYWWLELDEKPWLFGHLGMSGWIREIGGEGIRLHSHGEAPLDDEGGVPRFWKLILTTDEGRRIAFTDGRRLGRIWLLDNPSQDAAIKKLGPDALEELPAAKELEKILGKRKAPIKAVLLDQGVLSGVGNWIADEVLYHSRISPKRLANSLSAKEVSALRSAVEDVLTTAVDADADYKKFPDGWLFHHRWGGDRGADIIDGRAIVRETVGGRTSAWVPDLQR